MVCEYIDQWCNMETLFRWRKQLKRPWKAFELERIAASLVNALGYLQSIGICHRDIKPANLFIMPNREVKLIDFGEAKDMIVNKSDEPAMATIRGTPQYLSPILWKAHVIDGNIQQVRHNVYKSDVFSCGLVLMQLALVEDVTGFNQKTHGHNGERLVGEALKTLGKRCSKTYCAMVGEMLRFEESERPTFAEVASKFLEEPVGAALKEPPKLKRLEGDEEPEEEYSEDSPSQPLEDGAAPGKIEGKEESKRKSERRVFRSLATRKGEVAVGSASVDKHEQNASNGESTEHLLTQAELFQGYVKTNNLYVRATDLVYWFEYGGSYIGEYDIRQAEARWKLIGKYKHEFSYHFTLVFANSHGHFLLGPNLLGTCVQYKDRKLIPKKDMPQTKSFFCGIYLIGKIYTFGGYDVAEKLQLKTCEIYDVNKDSWAVNSANLNEARSQAGVSIMDHNTIYIFGGYNKHSGTLGSIEKYKFKGQAIELLKVSMPTPLRRLAAVKISPTKILLLGGVQKMNKESNAVYCFDLESKETVERLDKLAKGGIIEAPIAVDSVGNLHLFVENENGTAPPTHVSYTFLEYS